MIPVKESLKAMKGEKFILFKNLKDNSKRIEILSEFC